MLMEKTYFIVGGAGFIGSHLASHLLDSKRAVRVIIFDNFSSGKNWHLDGIKNNKNCSIVKDDCKDKDPLIKSMQGADIVYHFASNPEISKAITDPEIDFWEGTYLTDCVLEAMRLNSVKMLLYASGSGVYGDAGLIEVSEDYSPMAPVSTYGASKLACEALISSYCFMFGINAAAFRLGNVVGAHQTHGIGYDFIKKLLNNNKELAILGDGKQSKPYIYIDDVISAMRLIEEDHLHGFSCYNVATLDYITVSEIADIVTGVMGLENVKYIYSGGDRGWKGDVPTVRLNSNKIRGLGWSNKYNSREAILNSIKVMYEEAKENKFGWRKE